MSDPTPDTAPPEGACDELDSALSGPDQAPRVLSGPDQAPRVLSGPDQTPVEALEARGDVGGLLARAKQSRAAKDMAACLASYEAAARLGDGEAHYAVALFYLSGQVVAQDLKVGTTHLRAAAEAGVLPARMYLGNLYELGIHYASDSAKADVWYRSAARSAGIADDLEEHERTKRLADLGNVRAYLELASDESTTEDERAAWSKKARTLGYGLKAREDASRAHPQPARRVLSGPDHAPGVLSGPDHAPGVLSGPDHAPGVLSGPDQAPRAAETAEKAKVTASTATPGLGLRAFLLASLFLATGVAAGWLAMQGMKALVAGGGPLPILGDRPERALALVVALVGVLPALLVYRMRTVVASLGAAAATAGAGFWLHGSPAGTWLASRALQTSACAAAGFLAALLVFGLFGGAKAPKAVPKDL